MSSSAAASSASVSSAVSNPSATAVAAARPYWDPVCQALLNVDTLHLDREDALNAARSLHDELCRAWEANPAAEPALDRWDDLLALYRRAHASVQGEIPAIDHALSSLDAFESALYPPAPVPVPSPALAADSVRRPGLLEKKYNLKKKADGRGSRSWVAPPIVVRIGSLVGVRTESSAKEDAFLECEVLSLPRPNEYQVRDVDPDANDPPFVVKDHNVIPLPPADYPEIPVGEMVFAGYPGYTALYKATIRRGLARNPATKLLCYEVLFEGPHEKPTLVPKDKVTVFDELKTRQPWTE